MFLDKYLAPTLISIACFYTKWRPFKEFDSFKPRKAEIYFGLRHNLCIMQLFITNYHKRYRSVFFTIICTFSLLRFPLTFHKIIRCLLSYSRISAQGLISGQCRKYQSVVSVGVFSARHFILEKTQKSVSVSQKRRC